MSNTTDYQPAASTQQPAGIATASLVLGVVGFFVGICAVIGLILGLVARSKVKRGEISPARVKAGIIASTITLALNVIGGIIIGALLAGGAASTTQIDSAAAAPTVSEAPAEVVVAEPAPVVDAPAPVETVAPTTEPPAAAPVDDVISDGDWTLDKIQINDPALGITGADARLTNHGDAVSNGTVSITVDGSDGSFGTLTGFLSNVAAGDTVTVSLIGGDDVVDPTATDLKVSTF